MEGATGLGTGTIIIQIIQQSRVLLPLRLVVFADKTNISCLVESLQQILSKDKLFCWL